MRYQQTLEIHQRLETVLQLIRTGEYSTPALAESVGVSIPTISRIVASLREQGHDIRSERTAKGWRYVLSGKTRTMLRAKPIDSTFPTSN
jgi:predicted DNA-binding transcriptional regulator YafY